MRAQNVSQQKEINQGTCQNKQRFRTVILE